MRTDSPGRSAMPLLLAVLVAEASRELKRTADYQLGLVYRRQGRTAEAAAQMKLFEALK